MPEFRIGVAVWYVTARRNVEIVDRDPVDFRGKVPTITLGAEIVVRGFLDWFLGKNGKAIIAFFPSDRAMAVTHGFKTIMGKFVIRAFGFLQAENVGLLLFEEF